MTIMLSNGYWLSSSQKKFLPVFSIIQCFNEMLMRRQSDKLLENFLCNKFIVEDFPSDPFFFKAPKLVSVAVLHACR